MIFYGAFLCSKPTFWGETALDMTSVFKRNYFAATPSEYSIDSIVTTCSFGSVCSGRKFILQKSTEQVWEEIYSLHKGVGTILGSWCILIVNFVNG